MNFSTCFDEQLMLNLDSKNESSIVSSNDANHPFPATRYQGSKYKLIDWISASVEPLKYNTVLDAFGGTGCVAHMFKRRGKAVTYNDLLKFNHVIGKALIENNQILLDEDDVQFIINKHSGMEYPTFISDNFNDVFYLDEENAWLDVAITNISKISNEYKKSLAWYALFQACIIKRPYNLFHRANLNVRTADVKRSFGNKATWDKTFIEHFSYFVKRANQAVFDNGQACTSINYDALEIADTNFDLVYIDTPYISGNGVGTDYLDFYHFLEGMLDYDNWNNRILRKYKHMPIQGKGDNPWTSKAQIFHAFEQLFEKYQDSILVVSYRNDGIPSEEELIELLRRYKTKIKEVKSKDYKYVLSHNRSSEVLIIAE